MSLHLSYRPQSWNEFIGNEATVSTIKNKIYGEDPPHSILLHGPSGCGKTTLARIISAELKCDVDSADFVELDIAQLSGVDTAREIRQNMHFLPMDSNSKCRVWLLDEFHKASNAFMNGMLKALEDTPRHVFFILATTDPQKIIATVKTRCTQFKVNKLNSNQISELLNWILSEEEIKVERDVIDEIIKVADGCPREAVKILDQIIDLDPKDMIGAIQGTEVEKEVRELCNAMLRGASWPELADIIKSIKIDDAERARQAIIAWFSSVAIDQKGFNKNNKKKWDNVAARSAFVFDCFREPLFYTGIHGLRFAIYNTTL